ncbi:MULTISPECIES: hypothetical protein [unclassified Ruegeria]|uniref:hypothetical protein n=1 Tax=unclassified Ruegeria TaxID=2625375 RepID=UPI001488909C|nr:MULTISPECIES: hypothetical protein [unclassified Ruegeria]
MTNVIDFHTRQPVAEPLTIRVAPKPDLITGMATAAVCFVLSFVVVSVLLGSI